MVDTLSGSATEARRTVANTHVHLPPNFSAFDGARQAVGLAAAEGVQVLGASNYFDFGVYRDLADEADRQGITAEFGLEIIAVVDDLEARGVLVNDPSNPGRMYLCGKGMTAFDPPNERAADLLAAIRSGSERRMAEMVERLSIHFRTAGVHSALTAEIVADDVAARDGVPREWVVLQERHVARAFQEAIFDLVAPGRRNEVLPLLGLGVSSAVRSDDPLWLQNEIRSSLMKAGRPAFVPEVRVSFDDAYRLILELGGIPCYPTLADGATPVCAFEQSPDALAEALLERRVYFAELIPNRNRAQVVDEYVAAFRRAGILVLAGTEHNTQAMIPIEPHCLGGERLSEMAREAFWEGTCVVVAHQYGPAAGGPGYVDPDGRLAGGFGSDEERICAFREVGERVLSERATRVVAS